MSLIHRAVLYVTRKWSKSLLLFLMLLVIASLVLSGAAIRSATETAQLNVRQALGGVFTLRQHTNDPEKWVSSQVGSYGSSSYYGGAPLTTTLAESIQQSVAGIRGWNATYTSYVVPFREDRQSLDLIESEDDGSGLSSLLAGYGDFAKTVSAYASTNTAFDSYFTGGYLELVEGRHFTAEEEGAALISKQLAEKNGLTVGDTLTLRMSEFKASMMGHRASDTGAQVQIVGIFQATAKSSTSLSNWSMDNSLFTTLEAIRAARPDMGDESYEKITFYVDDPGDLAAIVDKVKALPSVNPDDFLIEVDSSSIDAVMEPLTNMNRLISILMALVLVVGAAVLYLVMSSRVKERVHESGVLLSLGLSKRNIVAQYIAEILMIAVLAFSASIVVSGAVAQQVGDQLLDYTIADTAPQEDTQRGLSKDGVIFSGSADYAPKFEGNGTLTRIDVTIPPSAIAGMYSIGFLIICVAIVMASLPVMRMKPREILSQMS